MKHAPWMAAVAAGLMSAASAVAQSGGNPPPQIDFVSMGGNDCPPCMAWRAVDLPKLQAMPEWKLMRFHYVTKSVKSSVPSAFFFPSESRHLQPALDEASNGWSGSPQQAILVNGRVVDYWWGTAKGEPTALAALVRALYEGRPPTRPVCAQLDTQTTCRKPG